MANYSKSKVRLSGEENNLSPYKEIIHLLITDVRLFHSSKKVIHNLANDRFHMTNIGIEMCEHFI